MSDAPKLAWAECADCGGSRRCKIRGQHIISGSERYVQWWDTYRILQCRGCESVFFQKISEHSESVEHDYDEAGELYTTLIPATTYWPPLSRRKKPEWLNDTGLPGVDTAQLDNILLELYSALNSGLNTLAAIGIRTAFDVAAKTLGADSSLPFADKLNWLVANKHIGVVDKNRIESIVDAGSASAHRGWTPEVSELNTMMDIIEHFINDAFVVPFMKRRLDVESTKMKAKVPPRDKKQKSNAQTPTEQPMPKQEDEA